jgi:hypothetical protein
LEVRIRLSQAADGNCGNQIPALVVSVEETDVSECRKEEGLKVIGNGGYYQFISVKPVLLPVINTASVERKFRTEHEVVITAIYL